MKEVFVVICSHSYKSDSYESVDSVFAEEANALKYSEFKNNMSDGDDWNGKDYYRTESMKLADVTQEVPKEIPNV